MASRKKSTKKKTPAKASTGKRAKTGSTARAKQAKRPKTTQAKVRKKSGAKTKRKVAKAARGQAASAKTAKKRTTARTKVSRTKKAQPRTKVRSGSAAGAGRARKGTRSASGLTAKDIETFRKMLLEKRAQLLGDVSTLRREATRGSRQDAGGELSSMPIHMAELGTDNYELEFTLRLVEDGRALLSEIDEALDRINNGTYGICQATGKPIGKARLKAKPWAKYCYEYVLAQETGQHR